MSETTTTSLLDAITVPAAEGRAIPDAATGETMGYAPVHGVDDLNRAVAAAREAQPAWAALSHAERSAILRRTADEVEAHAEELARIIAQEQGKPLNGPGARFEAGGCAAWIRNAADTALDARSRLRGARHPLGTALRPTRRRRSNRAVELAGDDRDLADRTVAADGQHRRQQALRVHPRSACWPSPRS